MLDKGLYVEGLSFVGEVILPETGIKDQSLIKYTARKRKLIVY